MSRVGIIVDGPGDYASVRTRFKNQLFVLKTDGPRGHTAERQDIVQNARKQLAMLAASGCEKAIVLTDFEERRESWRDFLLQLSALFATKTNDITVAVAVPNRLIENWYLADVEHLSRSCAFLRRGLHQKKYEGRNGKAELKRFFNSKESYRETDHGPKMFKLIRFPVARANSESFKCFLDVLESFGISV